MAENTYFENYKKSEVTNTRRVINTPIDYTRNNFLYIQEAGYLKSLKPHLSKRAGLKSYLFLIVLSGSGTVTYDGISYNATSNDCFLFDCRKECSHISSEDDPWELLWIHYYGANAPAYYKTFTEKSEANKFTSEHITTLIDDIYEIISLNETKSDDTDILTANLITDILTKSIISIGTTAASSSTTVQKLHQISNYINKNFATDITLEELSREFFISKYYLVREFKKEYGVTIVSYIQSKRITYAKELLRYSDSSIEEIASLCGINDASYFNKIFKKLENMTASQYRAQWN